MPMNLVHIAGVIVSPIVGESSDFASGRLLINETAKHRQVATLVALGQAIEEVRKFSVGDRVLIKGHLSVSANKLRIVVDSIEPNEVLPKCPPCTHQMQIPQMVSR
jgi:hypothetical protein